MLSQVFPREQLQERKLKNMKLGCEFAFLKEQATISKLHTSRDGYPGPFPDSEEEKVTTVRKATFISLCLWKETVFLVLTVMTCGLYWLVLRWYPNLMAKLRYRIVELDDDTAVFVLLESIDKEKEMVEITHMFKDSSGRWVTQKHPTSSLFAVFSYQRRASETPLLEGLNNSESWSNRMIVWRHVRIWYNPERNGWYQLTFGPSRGDYDFIHKVARKLARTGEEDSASRQQTYGKNRIEVEVAPFLSIAIQEALTPFVIFQVYSVIIWFLEDYVTYSLVIVIMTLSTILYSAYQIQNSQKSLQMLAKSEGVILRARFHHGQWNSKEIASSQLVPGDLVEVAAGMVCPCDLVLLSGQCIANESMLTGESAPVIKEPLPLEGKDFNPQTNRAMKHLLLSGSCIIQTKASGRPTEVSLRQSILEMDSQTIPVLAMVLHTGCETAKGKLIQTIQYPQDTRGFAHRQKEEAEGFVGFLFAATIVACIWFVCYAYILNFDKADIVIYALDLTTILVPAALPLILSVGVAFAFESLKKKQIYSSSTTHIVTAGHVDCICYDKTGTLTNEGDTFIGVHGISQSSFSELVRSVKDLPEDSAFQFLLAACHSLTYLVHKGHDEGELIGESLELEMFKASGWEYHAVPEQEKGFSVVLGREVPNYCNTAFLPPGGDSTFLAVLRIFPFDADLRTMSTVVLALDPMSSSEGEAMLLVKGAPEVIRDKCIKSSLPGNYDVFLEQLTKDGYRVLGCASKPLAGPDQKLLEESRSSMEKDLMFCGFLLMGNQLKPETKQVLSQVSTAELKQCMVTGDNILTALSVAKQCDNAFLSTDDIYIIDYSDYHHGMPEAVSLHSFTVMPLSSQNEEEEGGQPSNFQELLSCIEHNSKSLSLAISGDAFSALFDLHDTRRPNEFDNTIESPRRSNTLDGVVEAVGRTQRASVEFIEALVNEDPANDEEETPLEMILKSARVFARFKPHEKQLLMSVLQKIGGHYVCMVGDGANDSFALKTADVGLSICSNVTVDENMEGGQEAVSAAPSIAAPFSTPICHIGALIDLLCEGRGALACSVIAFRYMLHYGLIAFTQVILLYSNRMLLSDPMWVWGDLFMNLPLALVLDMTKCSNKLVKGVPETSILSWRFALAIFGHFVIILATQVAVMLYIKQQSWYVDPDGEEIETMVVTVIFWVSVSQYITSAIALAHNYGGFRAQWWTNKALVVAFFALSILQAIIILFNNNPFLKSTFESEGIPISFCWKLVLYIMATCFVHIIFESLLPHKAQPKSDTKTRRKPRRKQRTRSSLLELSPVNSRENTSLAQV
mmetsp:Transcript_12670/g.16488  ORF Transcript_12670/g.16488 Transcript_12670/m.16488 type:complete len:1306 (+) Transcript_12670:114-4031(+)